MRSWSFCFSSQIQFWSDTKISRMIVWRPSQFGSWTNRWKRETNKFKTMNYLTENLNTTLTPPLVNDGSNSAMLNNSDCKTWSFMNPNETIEIAYMISRAIVGVAAMIGNLLIVLSVIRFNYLKKASAYYLCNMALADFLLGLVGATYPFRVSYFSKTNQITRTLSFMVHNFAVLHSMCSMVIVAADRFSFICFPLTYEMNIFATTPYVFIVISILWTIALIVTLTYLFVWHGHIMMKIGSFFDLGKSFFQK